MSETQEDIDALLAEVNALANEAVADILGDDTISARTAEKGPAPSPPQPPARKKTGSSPRSDANKHVSRILNLQVPVIVQLAETTMPLSAILNLSTGSIIEFDKPSDGELDLMINNKCIGKGQAVKVGENFGLRLASMGSVRSRIKALGGQ